MFVCVAAIGCLVVLLPSPVSGSLPGDNGELLIFGGVGGERGLYLVDLQPLSLTKLPIEVHDLDLYSASWSPTGSYLAFTRYDPASEEHGRWLYQLATGETRQIRTAEHDEEYTGVSWSPSGSELVVGTIRQTLEEDGWMAGLDRVTPEGSLIDEVILPAHFVWEVEWSPTGSELLLWLGWINEVNYGDTRNSICLLSPETEDLDCIVNDGLWPSWSPDGMHIALNIDPEGLTVVNRAGSIVHEFDPPLPGRMTTWSPDGRFIAYPWYLGEQEAGQYAVGLVDLGTVERHAYVAGISNVLDMWWRPQRPASGFVDVPGTYGFAADVAWFAAGGYTDGCNPPLNTLFCPDAHVTRGQMAAFLHRTLDGVVEPSGAPIDFTDDDDSTFVEDIAWLSSTGITKGCTATEYCPERPVTRGEMAAFLVRALGYSDDGGGDLFVDDDESLFESDIDRFATAGVTRGCNPPVNNRFCPGSNVTRGQMAAFLHRALG